MAARERTLDTDALRTAVAHELCAWGPAGNEGYALTLEALPVRWPRLATTRTWARTIGSPPEVPDPAAFRAAVERVAGETGTPFHPEGRWAPGPRGGAWIELGPGGQVVVQSGWQGTPARAHGIATGVFDALRGALEREGFGLVCMGRDPWHGPGARALEQASVWATLEERALGASGERGLEALRSTCGAEVRVAFGGPQKGPRRWRAAWLLVPRLIALFGHSPLEESGSARCRSARARAWSLAAPGRGGIPATVQSDPHLAAHETVLDFALAANVLWVVRDGRVYEPAQPTTFARWLAAGVDGWYPELDDWRAHLAGLRPLVRPEGALVIDAIDAQARPFAGLPLLVTAALLCDDAALEELLAELGGSEAELGLLHGVATADGLLDARLAGEARKLMGLVAEALLRAPRGWASPEMVAALVAFDQAFTRQGRAPADELLELYLERGALDREGLEGLESRWCAAAGTPVSWRDAPRHA